MAHLHARLSAIILFRYDRPSSSFVCQRIDVSMARANCESIELGSFTVGQSIEAYYTAPTTGKITVNLEAADGTVVLHVDYRKLWQGNPESVLVLNTKIGGSWGPEQRVKELFTTPGTEMAWKICAKDKEFSIVLNHKEIATYAYRTPVTSVRKVLFTNYGEYDSVLRKLCVVYSEPALALFALSG